MLQLYNDAQGDGNYDRARPNFQPYYRFFFYLNDVPPIPVYLLFYTTYIQLVFCYEIKHSCTLIYHLYNCHVFLQHNKNFSKLFGKIYCKNFFYFLISQYAPWDDKQPYHKYNRVNFDLILNLCIYKLMNNIFHLRF